MTSATPCPFLLSVLILHRPSLPPPPLFLLLFTPLYARSGLRTARSAAVAGGGMRQSTLCMHASRNAGQLVAPPQIIPGLARGAVRCSSSMGGRWRAMSGRRRSGWTRSRGTRGRPSSRELDPKPSAPPLTCTEVDGSAHLLSASLASDMDHYGSGSSLGYSRCYRRI